ncbi:BRCA2, oligonucleotide/oligosaccharide-binding, domain 1-domain-containing protein, partial [Phakopsora pachyrhizi]
MSSWLAPPRAFSPRQLLSLAIPESIVYMTVKSAAIWNFHAFTEPFGAIHALGELIEAGCEINLSKPNWVANHWWMIIWKLASVIKWRPDFLLRLWTPENVVNQLKYRYEREFICGHRPVIKQILEHDCPTIIPMCLVIVSINRQLLAKGGAELKKSSGSSSEVDTHTFELSDGWYKIKATLDQVLERVVSRKKLKVGYKLALSGVSFENTSSNTMKSSKSDINKGRLDLELEEVDDLKLHLEGNSTARATWHEPLGFRTRPWFASLRSLTHDGGRIPLVDVLITEIFPAMFISDDLKMGRWGADQEKKLQLAWEIEREKEAELISRERRQIQERMLSVLDLIFEACSGVGSPSQEFEKLSSELDLEDTFEELMESNNQEASLIKKLPVGFIRQLQDFAREKLENFRSSGPSEVQKILDERIPIRRVRSIRILRIRDYQTFKKVNSNESRSAQLLIHDLSRIQDGFLKEGHRYWIENLQPQKNSNWDSRKFDSKNEISIVTRRNTRWREVSLEI